MHELGVTFHIMDHLEKVAAENKVTHVRKVTLELGEVSTVIESYLQNCWTWAAKKRPLFDESELVVETLPALTYCEDCKQTYPTEKPVHIAEVSIHIYCREMSSTLRK